jgi:hypothetical protein
MTFQGKETKLKKYNAINFISGIIILVSLCFPGCKNWEHGVEKNGIHFKKISQSESGTIIGFMTEDHEIQGFPCKSGWIHFKEDFILQSFQLSREFTFNNTLLPAHTWIHLPYKGLTGYILSLPFDYQIQGHLCGGSGGYKGTQTGFYDSGRLRSFYSPEEITVNGVPCETSILNNVNLHENGNIGSCKLSKDYKVDGVTYKKGSIIELYESGKIK